MGRERHATLFCIQGGGGGVDVTSSCASATTTAHAGLQHCLADGLREGGGGVMVELGAQLQHR